MCGDSISPHVHSPNLPAGWGFSKCGQASLTGASRRPAHTARSDPSISLQEQTTLVGNSKFRKACGAGCGEGSGPHFDATLVTSVTFPLRELKSNEFPLMSGTYNQTSSNSGKVWYVPRSRIPTKAPSLQAPRTGSLEDGQSRTTGRHMRLTLISQRLLAIGVSCSRPPKRQQEISSGQDTSRLCPIWRSGEDGWGSGYTLLEENWPIVPWSARSLVGLPKNRESSIFTCL